ncbi:MAG: DUF2911 domain-containing protein [Gemmatimonadota bacterium]|nr:DUF2911 domain-containing protein [Gemmatimonadota bacterium]MDH4352170.1 DUF2911 domain-containing protein [Gemmatimonadota bacterium]MDH5196000.1 DUF2911 domain-containing protein [Gemmatimonadota bacterium]
MMAPARIWVGVAALAIVGSLAAGAPAEAQIYASERSTLTQNIAGTVITIDYSRPSLRGRDSVFGLEVTWGEVWTPGANQATTLTLSKGVRLAGQEIPAGKYSVWIKTAADADWLFLLHPDTTLFHIPHPSVDDMIFAIPVAPQVTNDVRETLAWNLERVRATGARLQMHWDRTLISLDLGVDAVVETTIPAATGRPYAGTWAVVYGPPDPAQSADTVQSQAMTLRYDDATQQVLGLLEFPGVSETADIVLVPKAEGVFLVGFLMAGELVEASDDFFLEFVFENGHPVSFAGRGADDTVFARGVRTQD